MGYKLNGRYVARYIQRAHRIEIKGIPFFDRILRQDFGNRFSPFMGKRCRLGVFVAGKSVQRINPSMHDREVRLGNGWVIKIGRGLDFYQKPNGWFEIGAHELSLRKCLETKVDIFRAV